MKRTNFWHGAAFGMLAAGVILVAGTGSVLAQNDIDPANATAASANVILQISCQEDEAQMSINNHGNIVEFESPLKYEHIGVGVFSEGYVLKYFDGLVKKTIYDIGLPETTTEDVEFGWGEPAFIPNGNFIVRFSLDGLVKLTQIFTPDCPQRKLIVFNKIERWVGEGEGTGAGVSLTDVCFARHVDFDVDTGDGKGGVRDRGACFHNNHAATKDAYISWNDKRDSAYDFLEPIPDFPGSGGCDPIGKILKRADSMHLSLLEPVFGAKKTVAKVTDDVLNNKGPAKDVAKLNPRLNFDDGGRIEVKKDVLSVGEALTVIVEYKRD